MSSFVLRRARTLAIEAEQRAERGEWAEAEDCLQSACGLLRSGPAAIHADLPALLRRLGDLAAQAGHEEVSDASYLEAQDLEREQRAVSARLEDAACLPADAAWRRLEERPFEPSVSSRLEELRSGAFVLDRSHLLVRGAPGRGKSVLVGALGAELVARGIPVLFRPGVLLCEELQRARRDLDLSTTLRRFDAFDLVIVDGLPEPSEVVPFRCLEIFLEDRAGRASVALAVAAPSHAAAAGEPTRPRWLRLLSTTSEAIVLDLDGRIPEAHPEC